MTSIHVEVTAEDVVQAGPWPRPPTPPPRGWKSPVELALGRLTGVDVDVDGDEESWHATIGTMEGSTLVVDLPELAKERLDFYYAHEGLAMEPFAFDIEVDAWLVALINSDVEDLVAALAAARLWLVGEYAEAPRAQFNTEAWTRLVDRVGLALSGQPGWMHTARTFRIVDGADASAEG